MRRVLHQRVLEAVDRVGRRAALEDQLGGDEAGKSGLQFVLGKAGDRPQQRVGKLASDRRADLRHKPHRRQAVEPRHQRGMQGSSGSQTAATRGRGRSDPSPSRSRPLSNTLLVSSSTNSGTPSVRSAIWSTTSSGSALPGDLRDQGGPVAPVQAVETPAWSPAAGRSRAAGTRGGTSRSAAPAGCGHARGEVEQLARGRVDPMRVFEDHHHRLLARQTLELPDQRLQVRSFLRCGLRLGSGWRSEAGNDSRSARNATSSSGGSARASKASSFSIRDAGVSSRANPAARPSWSTNGNSALSW